MSFGWSADGASRDLQVVYLDAEHYYAATFAKVQAVAGIGALGRNPNNDETMFNNFAALLSGSHGYFQRAMSMMSSRSAELAERRAYLVERLEVLTSQGR